MNKKNILIVEDEENWRRIIRVRLTNAGYNVLEADGCLTALAVAAWNDIDCVVLDFGLRGYNGSQIIDWFEDRRIPAFFYTAYDTSELQDRFPELRKYVFVSKNANDFSELLETLAMVTTDYSEAAVK